MVLTTRNRAHHCHQIISAPQLVHALKKSKERYSTEQHQINMEYPEQLVRIGAHLIEETKAQLVALLSNPVKQKKRGQAVDRNKAINTKVVGLVSAGILREVIFPTWIANLVMVRKANGAWRMCIDYSDLNNACPKDCYPLTEIDQKVQLHKGFRFKCFLDAYKGYHQVQM
uniref:Reverse transcriptase domain-containing protein n=1 Tax=Lactuca sativa TaxID=4236 RepID=A0A9R1WK93_LACSA|nr:hypothetical protein LSAT_V11C100009920 [Lactuca sativa]